MLVSNLEIVSHTGESHSATTLQRDTEDASPGEASAL
jgi:hypothetical protein